MEKDNSFRRAFYHLKASQEYFQDVVRSFPDTIGAKAAKRYLQKISWCLMDFSTDINFPNFALDDFKKEISGDIFFHDSLSRLCIGLSDEQKSTLESMVELLIAGETISYEIKKPE